MLTKIKQIRSILFVLLAGFSQTGFALTFQPAQVYPASSALNAGPESVECGDLDQDGFLDLVTADNGFISLYFGDGGGNFPRRHAIATRVTNATDQAGGEENEYASLFDLNKDGLLDILVANAPNPGGSAGNSIQIYYNQPLSPGTFVSPPVQITADMGVNPTAVRAGHFNPGYDSLPDLALSLYLDPRLLTYLGTSGGGFNPFFESALISQSAGENLDLGDFNEDGLLDIAMVDRLRVWVFFGDGSGWFPNSINLATGGSGAHLEYDVLMRDMDGDHHLDLVVANGGLFNTLTDASHAVAILYGNGTSQPPAQSTFLDPGKGVTKIATADFNGDSFLDIAAVLPGDTFTNGTVMVFLNDGAASPRTYASSQPLSFSAEGRVSMGISADDFNRDGRADLAVANEGFIPSGIPGNLVVFLNALPAVETPTPTSTPTQYPAITQTPTRTATPTRTLSPTRTLTPRPTLSPDINGDGRVDSKDLQILIEQQGNQVP